MLDIIGVTIPYFALIGCGFAARWMGLMGAAAPRILNDFVLYFALPALMIRTLGGIPFAEIVKPGFLAAWGSVSLAIFFGTLAASALFFRQGGLAATIHAAAAAHGNVGYLGITLVIGLLGAEATAQVAMAILFDMFVLVPLAIMLVELFGAGKGLKGARRAARAALANPFTLAIGGGLALSLAGWAPPGPVDDFMRVLGMAAIPAALFAIGVTLYGQPLRAAAGEIGALALFKLMLHPVAMILVTTSEVFALSRQEIAAATLLAALPVANNVFVIATRYDIRPGRISSTIFFTTLGALASFNLWAWLLMS